MGTEAEAVAREWFDSIQKAIDDLGFGSHESSFVNRDLEGGNMQICPVQVKAGRESYTFDGDIRLPGGNGPGSLYGTCVHPLYMARETFEKVFDAGSLLPIEVLREDWPLSVSNWAESSSGWSYEFGGPGFYLVDPVISGRSLGYMREGEFRENFPLFAKIFDVRYKNRLCSNCIGGV